MNPFEAAHDAVKRAIKRAQAEELMSGAGIDAWTRTALPEIHNDGQSDFALQTLGSAIGFLLSRGADPEALGVLTAAMARKMLETEDEIVDHVTNIIKKALDPIDQPAAQATPKKTEKN